MRPDRLYKICNFIIHSPGVKYLNKRGMILEEIKR